MTNYVGNINVFDHNLQEWPVFKGRLNQYIKLNSVDDESKGALLITHLSDDTYRLTRDLLFPATIEEVKFDELIITLDSHFTPKRCLLADREKFYEARRAPGESIDEWAVRVRGLAVHCAFEGSLDEQLRDRFVLGLGLGPERDRIFEQSAAKLSFSKALEVAQQAASARAARSGAAAAPRGAVIKEEQLFRAGGGGTRGAGGGVNTATAGDSGAAYAGESQRCCSVCGMKKHEAAKCRYKHFRCQVCGVKGHLRKVCKAKKASLHSMCSESTEDQGSVVKDDQEQCHECKMFNLRYVDNLPMLLDVYIGKVKLCMELDSGSGTSVVSDKIYFAYFSKIKLYDNDMKICLYNGHKISPIGYFITKVNFKDQEHNLKIYVIGNGGPPLLGRDFMTKFGYYLTCNNSINSSFLYSSEVLPLIKHYSELFDGTLGKFNKFEIELHLKPGSVPKFFKPRTVPFAIKGRVEEEIQRLVNLGILVPVKYAKYATPIVPVLKEDGKVKIAGDFSITLNKDLEIEKYPMPRIEEVFSKIGGGQKYTKIDLSNAYNQFCLHESSQELTTITTSIGMFKYTRLVYGLSNAPAIFQRSMESLLCGIQGVSCWLDDICVTGPTKEIHLNRLNEVLYRLREAGLKLQKDKCRFFQDSVTYLGYVISKDGLKACTKKVEAIINAPRPSNVLQVKQFLGMVNYYRNFLPQASSKLHPLHELLRAGAEFKWSDRHEHVFVAIKKELASDRVLGHFDPEAQLVLTVDASPHGLGAVLAQIDREGRERPLAFASRSLTPSERNYSQIQKEATAIIFGVKHFHQYLYGRETPFILKTDHRPLLSIFGKKVGVSIMAASRLQRYAIILSAYNYIVQYINSDNNAVADYFSRAPLANSDSCDTDIENISFLKFLSANIAPVTFEDIKKASFEDNEIQTVIKYVKNGWPRKISCPTILPYFRCKMDLEVEGNCLFRGHRVVIPTLYRNTMLRELHSGHFGIVKSKGLARSRFWWPSIDKEIEQWVGSCEACMSVRAAPPRAAPAPWPPETAPWSRLHIDYFSIANKTFLVVIDAYSKWLECVLMNGGTSTRDLICKLKEIFATHGIPITIVSDNDVKINSLEFNQFCALNGIRYVTSPIYHPCSNGQAENSVRTCKNMIKSYLKETGNSYNLNEKLSELLFNYRNTPHCTSGVTPAKLLLGRELRSRLDLVMPTNSQKRDVGSSIVCKRQFEVDDLVWLTWYVSRKEIWTVGKIIRKIGNRMYEVMACDYNVICKRHIDQLRRYVSNASNVIDDCELSEDNDVAISESANQNDLPSQTPLLSPTPLAPSPGLAFNPNTKSNGQRPQMVEEEIICRDSAAQPPVVASDERRPPPADSELAPAVTATDREPHSSSQSPIPPTRSLRPRKKVSYKY